MKSVFIMVALLSSGHVAAAQNARVLLPESVVEAEKLYQAAAVSQASYHMLKEFLERHPDRVAGGADEAEAAEWAIEILRRLGADSVWLERFPVSRWVLDRMAIEIVDGEHPLGSFRARPLAGSASTEAGRVTGNVVRIPSFSSADALAPGAVAGMVVFVDRTMVRSQDGQGFVQVNSVRSAVLNKLARAGAAAVLFRAHGTGADTLVHFGGVGYQPDTRRIPALTLPNLEADRLREILLSGRRLDARITVEARIVPGVSTNAIADFKGSSSRVVLAAAHLDAWGMGAADDGAGVITILEAARLIAEQRARDHSVLPSTLRIALFGAEEIGLHGARAHLTTYPEKLSLFAVESDQGAGPIYRLRMPFAPDQQALRQRWAQFLEPHAVDVVTDKSVAGPDLIPYRERGAMTFDLLQDMTHFFDFQHTNADSIDKVSETDLRHNIGIYAGVLHILLQAQP